MHSKLHVSLLCVGICFWQISMSFAFPESKSLLPQKGECGFSMASRIIGGELAADNEFPWMAFVQFSKKLPDGKTSSATCSGSLINDRYVITAAHCIHNDHTYTVYLGENHRAKFSENALKLSAEPIAHEKYGSSGSFYDIALLRLETKVKYSHKISPICLPQTSVENYNMLRTVEAVGWGKIDRQGTTGMDLKKLTMSEVMPDKCQQIWKNMDLSQICTYAESCQQPFHGDSGGPIQWAGDGYYVLIGLTSFGSGGAICDNGVSMPTVFTRVSHYLDWIKDHVKE